MNEQELSLLHRSWVEIDTEALKQNLSFFKQNLTPGAKLAPVVKSNAYGHGLLCAAKAFVQGGADWLCVDALSEALRLKFAEIDVPVLILGHVPAQDAPLVVEHGFHLVVYLDEQLDALEHSARASQQVQGVHLKLETGTNRQGLRHGAMMQLAHRVVASKWLRLEGISSHFANIEDTTDHRFAEEQISRFEDSLKALSQLGVEPPYSSIANSAATLLWPRAHYGLVRPGIAAYGMWPSKETFLSVALARSHPPTGLKPALTWKTRIAQVKSVPPGEAIGYGCSYRCTHTSRIAILPVGYYDGYDRGLSNKAYVLINGERAYLRGRVCMNMVMVDVTDLPNAQVGTEVVLLGRQEEEELSAEDLASWCNTINYEITTRILEAIPRKCIGAER